ncbi:hypothetical protein WN944_018039 [Citrus x changshan-huyou]|uniref:14-3-3 domain-containing protein n=1 Tax=Citrus x changshan-huyou TaxID=2935761 RepID=A0AAP0QI41_9ROSI
MAAPSPREENVYMAKLAEQAEWYEEMIQYMEKVVVSASTSEEPPLRRLQERHRRTARLLKDELHGNQDHVSVIKEYRSKIEAELTEICGGILKLLDQKLVPTAAAADSKVFYLKMKGDYLLRFKIVCLLDYPCVSSLFLFF